MPAPLKINLTEQDRRTLRELSYANNVAQRVKQRAAALRLNAAGWKVHQIAVHLDWAQQTVRETIHRWQERGLGGLWENRRPFADIAVGMRKMGKRYSNG